MSDIRSVVTTPPVLYIDGVYAGRLLDMKFAYEHTDIWTDGTLDGTYVPKIADTISRLDRVDITTSDKKEEVCA